MRDPTRSHYRVWELRRRIDYLTKATLDLQRQHASTFASIASLREGLDETSRELIEAEADALAAGEPCPHAATKRGKNYPLRYGSLRTEVCLGCGAWRTHGHNETPLEPGGWRPADEYEAATTRDDDD